MKWIDIDYSHPDKEGLYLCRFDDGSIETFPIYDDDIYELDKGRLGWGVRSFLGRPSIWVTHWMPLPKQPEDV